MLSVGKTETIVNIFLAAGAVVSFLGLVYLIYFYGWTSQGTITNWNTAVLYCSVPATGATLLFASLQLTLRYKLGFAIFSVSLVVLLYGAEILLFLFRQGTAPLSQSEAVELAKRLSVKFDARNHLEIIDAYQNNGISAVSQIVLPMFQKEDGGGVKSAIQVDGAEIMPIGGISKTRTVVCNQSGEYLTYQSDEHGFHNPGGKWQSPVEIVAVGNSRTMGYCVSSEKNFVALIRQRYDRVLNLGMPGQGPLHILGAIKEYLPSIKPKLVLWFYYEGNNLSELQDEQRSKVLRGYLSEGFSQDLLARQTGVDSALMRYVERINEQAPSLKRNDWRVDDLIKIVKLSAVRRKSGMGYGRNDREIDLAGPTMDLFFQILSLAKAHVSGWGGKIYFVYLPSWERYAYNDSGVAGEQRARILSFADGLHIPIIDLYPLFQSHGDPLSLFPFRRFAHYNEAGHRVVAREVLKVLSADGTLDSRLGFGTEKSQRGALRKSAQAKGSCADYLDGCCIA